MWGERDPPGPMSAGDPSSSSALGAALCFGEFARRKSRRPENGLFELRGDPGSSSALGSALFFFSEFVRRKSRREDNGLEIVSLPSIGWVRGQEN